MKRIRFVFGIVLAFAMIASFLGVKSPKAKAAVDIAVIQTAAKTNSISFRWVWDGKVNIILNDKVLKKNYSKKSFTLKKKGMTAGQSYSVKVIPVEADEGAAYTVRTTPSKITIGSFGHVKDSDLSSLSWNPNNTMCDGYQIKLYDKKGKVKNITDIPDPSISAYENLLLDANKFYKARIRGYIKLEKTVAYGAWSGYKYAANMKDILIVKQPKDHSIKVSWKKVKNASKYEVLVGTKADGSDAVVTKTLKPKKTSVTLKTMGNKGVFAISTYYYVFIRPYLKVGKKHKKSDLWATGDPVVFYAFD